MPTFLENISKLLENGTIALTAIVVVIQGIAIALINRQFLKKNTVIAQEVQNSFSKVLAEHKYLLDQSLISYKSDTDTQLARQIEPLKASLSKTNLAFQITHTEFVKKQFIHVEQLFALGFELQRHILLCNVHDKFDQSYADLVKDITVKDDQLLSKFHMTSFYLSDSAIDSSFKFIRSVNELSVLFYHHRDEIEFLRNSTTPNSPERNNTLKDIAEAKEKIEEKVKEVSADYNTFVKELKKLMTSSLGGF